MKKAILAVSGGILTALALPVAGHAVDAFTSVVLQDPSSGAQASVTQDGQLRTSTDIEGTPFHASVLVRPGTQPSIEPDTNAWWIRVASITLTNTGRVPASDNVDAVVTCDFAGGSYPTLGLQVSHIATISAPAYTTVTIPFPVPAQADLPEFCPGTPQGTPRDLRIVITPLETMGIAPQATNVIVTGTTRHESTPKGS